jgi:hypothetical protein
VVFKNGEFQGHYVPDDEKKPPAGGFEVHGGATLIFDLDSLALKYAISKPLLQPNKLDERKREINRERIARQRRYQHEVLPLSMSETGQYFGAGLQGHIGEPFSLLHQR